MNIPLSLIPLLLCAPSAAPAAAPAPSPLVARSAHLQDEEGAKPDARPEVKELVTELGEHLKKKGKEDELALQVLDKVTQEFEKSGPKDRLAIVAAAAATFDEKRPKELSEGVPDTRIYDAAAVALGYMGPESVQPLIALIDHKNLKKLLATRGNVIRSLGKTKHLDGVKPLRELLQDKDVEIITAAAQALGSYDGAPQDVRKDTFENLLKTLMSAKGAVDSDPQDMIARDRYQAIAASIITSLGALSGHDERAPEDWQRWWNKNKKEDWDKKAG